MILDPVRLAVFINHHTAGFTGEILYSVINVFFPVSSSVDFFSVFKLYGRVFYVFGRFMLRIFPLEIVVSEIIFLIPFSVRLFYYYYY